MLIFFLFFLLHAFNPPVSYAACPSVEPLALAITEKKSDSEIIEKLEIFVKDGGDLNANYCDYPNILHLAIDYQCSWVVVDKIFSSCPADKRVALLTKKGNKEKIFYNQRESALVIAFCMTPHKSFDALLKKMKHTSYIEIFAEHLTPEQILTLLQEKDYLGNPLLHIALRNERIKDFDILFQKLTTDDKRKFLVGENLHDLVRDINPQLYGLKDVFRHGSEFKYIFEQYKDEKELLKNLMKKKNIEGKSILHLLVESIVFPEVVKLVIDEYARVVNNDKEAIKDFLTAQDNNGNTALVLAVTPTWCHKEESGMIVYSDFIFHEKIKQIIFAYERYISEDKREIYNFLSIKNKAGEDILERLKKTSKHGIFHKEIILKFISSYFQKEEEKKDFSPQHIHNINPITQKSSEALANPKEQSSFEKEKDFSPQQAHKMKDVESYSTVGIEESEKTFATKKYVLGATVLFAVLGVTNELREAFKNKFQNQQKPLAAQENKDKGLLSFIKRKKLTLSLFACAGLCGVSSVIISK